MEEALKLKDEKLKQETKHPCIRNTWVLETNEIRIRHHLKSDAKLNPDYALEEIKFKLMG